MVLLNARRNWSIKKRYINNVLILHTDGFPLQFILSILLSIRACDFDPSRFGIV